MFKYKWEQLVSLVVSTYSADIQCQVLANNWVLQCTLAVLAAFVAWINLGVKELARPSCSSWMIWADDGQIDGWWLVVATSVKKRGKGLPIVFNEVCRCTLSPPLLVCPSQCLLQSHFLSPFTLTIICQLQACQQCIGQCRNCVHTVHSQVTAKV